MKMSDIFNLPLKKGYRSVYIDNDEKPCVLSGKSSVLIARPKYINNVCVAINNHDRLIDLLVACADRLDAECGFTGEANEARLFIDKIKGAQNG